MQLRLSTKRHEWGWPVVDEPKTRNKGGRPPKDPSGSRSPTVTFRCRPALQSSLKTNAEKSGHSLSEEIERRLEQSFMTEDIATAVKDVVQKTATIAAAEATTNLLSNWAGDRKYFNIGLEFATTIRHAMQTNGIGDIPISDIHKHPTEMDWIKGYINKCMDRWFETPGMSLDFDRVGRRIGENLLAGAYDDEEIGKKNE